MNMNALKSAAMGCLMGFLVVLALIGAVGVFIYVT